MAAAFAWLRPDGTLSVPSEITIEPSRLGVVSHTEVIVHNSHWFRDIVLPGFTSSCGCLLPDSKPMIARSRVGAVLPVEIKVGAYQEQIDAIIRTTSSVPYDLQTRVRGEVVIPFESWPREAVLEAQAPYRLLFDAAYADVPLQVSCFDDRGNVEIPVEMMPDQLAATIPGVWSEGEMSFVIVFGVGDSQVVWEGRGVVGKSVRREE